MDVTPFEAVQRMRQLSDVGVPFKFSFQTLNTTQGTSDGLKVVERAQIRLGLRNDQSSLAHQLIAYVDLDSSSAPRFFHLPLLMSFNEHSIKP